jgi:hypothetical protein
MKNKEYISELVRTGKIGNMEAKNSRNNSLVFQNGVLFSYGRHYPLLFKIKGFIFCNIAGYSMTTAKHIVYSGYLSDYTVRLTRGKLYMSNGDYTALAVKKDLILERKKLEEKLAGLGTRAWKQKEFLINRLAEIEKTLEIFE